MVTLQYNRDHVEVTFNSPEASIEEIKRQSPESNPLLRVSLPRRRLLRHERVSSYPVCIERSPPLPDKARERNPERDIGIQIDIEPIVAGYFRRPQRHN